MTRDNAWIDYQSRLGNLTEIEEDRIKRAFEAGFIRGLGASSLNHNGRSTMSDNVTGNYTTDELLGAIEALIAAAEAAGGIPDPVIQRAKKALALLRSG